MESRRLKTWEQRLAPIRLGAEPVELQLRRRFLALILGSGLMVLMGLMILAIFAAFERPDVGGWLFLLGFAPAIGWGWVQHGWLRSRVAAYFREIGEPSKNDAPPV